jgi:flagellar assembly factor FliW
MSLPLSSAQGESAAFAPGINLSHAIRFGRGLPGFEACRSFVLMAPEGEPNLQYLKAVEGPPASFLVIDPRRVVPTYNCELSDADRLALGAGADTPLLWLALLTVEANGTVTANLRAPIVINPVRMVGQQVIPQHSVYPLRHVVIEAE